MREREPLPSRVRVRVKDGREGVIVGPMDGQWDWLVEFADGHSEGFTEAELCVINAANVDGSSRPDGTGCARRVSG